MQTNLDFVKETSGRVLLQNGSHSPQMCLFGKKGNVFVLIGDFPSDSRIKEMIMLGLGHKTGSDFKMQQQIGELEETYFISEAWISIVKKEDLNNNTLKVMPSDDPNKVEIIIIAGKNIKTDKMTFNGRKLIRNKEGKIIKLEEMSYPTDKFESYLLDAFFKGYKIGEQDLLKKN